MQRVFPFLAVALFCIGADLRAEVPWPQAILELESAALRDPRPGSAWLHLRQYAVAAGRYAELRQRWETGDAAGLILLGWLDMEAGEVKAARGRFARAVAAAPKSHHAWLALAEAQLRAGEAAGEVSVGTAAKLAGDEAGRLRALRLPGLTAQERGDLAGAWAAWKKLEAAPLAPSVRVALIPDFARAHLATGDADEWSARLVAAAPESADAAASGVAACLALGDAALAHRLVTAALARDAAHAGLLKLAVAAARGAGFNGEAAARVEAALGDAPDDDALVSALEAFTKLGAPDHAVRLCRGHAARLAPIATRWRKQLLDLWRLGATPELREIFAPQAAAGGWEPVLVSAELAMLEKDYATATELLWRLCDKEFEARPLATLAAAPGTASEPPREREYLRLAGDGLRQRFALHQLQLRAGQYLLDPQGPRFGETRVDLTVYVLGDARDGALAYLRKMALREGGEDLRKFPARLRARTAHWPVEERLLAGAAVGTPAEVLDAAGELLARPAVSAEAADFVRAQFARVGAADLSVARRAQLVALRAKLPPQPPGAADPPALEFAPIVRVFGALERGLGPASGPSLERRWHAGLRACWEHFDAGRFAEADRAFAATLDAVGAAGQGPLPLDWSKFHVATFRAVAGFDTPAEKLAAASWVLRWLAWQSPRRTDWPAPPQPQMLWRTGQPTLFWPMFYPARQGVFFFNDGGISSIIPACGGSLPDDQLSAIFTGATPLRGNPAELALRTDGLAPESARLLTLADALQRFFRHGGGGHPVQMDEMEKLFATPDGPLARMLATRLAAIRQRKGGEVPADFLTPGLPAGPVGRAAWIVAQLKLAAHQTPRAELLPLAEELAERPLDALTYAAAREACAYFAAAAEPAEAPLWKALSGRLTLARLRASAAEPLPAGVEERLILLTEAAEADEAVALAQRALAWPALRVERTPALWSVQRQAITTLNTCGELGAWLAGEKKAAPAGAAPGWRRLVEKSDLILQTIPESTPPTAGARGAAARPRTDPLDTMLRRDALAALGEASQTLVRLEPASAWGWHRLQSYVQRARTPNGPPPAADLDLELLLRGAAGELSVGTAASFMGADLDRLTALLDRWPVRKAQAQDPAAQPYVGGVELATQLWRAGKRDKAARWLQKLFDANDAEPGNAVDLRNRLLETLALRDDRAGVLAVLARGLRDSLAHAEEGAAFPRQDFWGNPIRSARPLRPLCEQAAALGLAGELRAQLERDGGASADLALLLRAAVRDATVLTPLSPRLDQPMPAALREDFAALLAPWPEARKLAQKILREPDFSTGPAERLARGGLLAAQCGLPDEAARWLGQALQTPRTDRGDRMTMLLDIVEGFSLITPAGGGHEAAEELKRLIASGRGSTEVLHSRLLAMAGAGREAAFRQFADIVAGKGPVQNRSLANLLADGERILAASRGEWGEATPGAWLHGAHDDGTAQVAWAVGWTTAAERGGAAIFQTASASSAAAGKPLRVELFWGENKDRMVRIATIEKAAATGVWRGRLPQPQGVLAASISFDGQTVTGPATPFRAGKNFLPPLAALLAKLPPLLWSGGTTGPGGETLRGVRLTDPRQGGELLSEAEWELPGALDQNLTVSGWVKGGAPGQVGLMLLVPGPTGEQRQHVQKLSFSDSPAWRRFEFSVPADRLGQPVAALREKGARLFLTLAPGGEYSGLQVTATDPLPAAARAPGAAPVFNGGL
jgi:tetratricopeptide (TPR) repeat protein